MTVLTLFIAAILGTVLQWALFALLILSVLSALGYILFKLS